MATVRKEIIPPVPQAPEVVYHLDLSEEEAEVIFVILGAVAGNVAGHRGKAQKVYDALSDVIPYSSVRRLRESKTGIIKFYDIKGES